MTGEHPEDYTNVDFDDLESVEFEEWETQKLIPDVKV